MLLLKLWLAVREVLEGLDPLWPCRQSGKGVLRSKELRNILDQQVIIATLGTVQFLGLCASGRSLRKV